MDTLPWYKQFWPWFIMALPATVVVAGLSTWYIAEQGADHLVVQNYYKEGLSINLVLDKQKLARELELVAALEFQGDFLKVSLTGNSDPAALGLKLWHPMDENFDMELKLARESRGQYRGRLPYPISQRWHWQLEPLAPKANQAWRLDGEITIVPGDDPQ